jgi:glycerol-3-phosphate dehydrogenase (NAD(P)+)
VKLAILGAGSFGTALSIVSAENFDNIWLWSHSHDIVADIAENHENKVYLPGIHIPEKINPSQNLEEVLDNADMVLSVIPTQATREVWQKAKNFIQKETKIIVASKGIEINTHQIPGEILLDTLGETARNKLFFLSGPSFAREIAEKRPTAITIAGYNTEKIPSVQEMFFTDFFRTYGTKDVVGVQLGGALKNVIAIAVGISDGLDMGNNSRAALITRGLAEIARLGKVMGADPMTFMGLAGLGDLVLTCTGDLSRNRKVGLQLGQGRSIEEIQNETRMIAEGVSTTLSAYEIAVAKNIQMPITEGVYNIIYQKKRPEEVIPLLMSRQKKFENE